jgi:hypothetical protein
LNKQYTTVQEFFILELVVFEAEGAQEKAASNPTVISVNNVCHLT